MVRTNPESTSRAPEPQSQSITENLMTALSNSLFSSSSIKLTPFSGNERESVEWLENFEEMATTFGWSRTTRAKRFPAYLLGPAKSWYRTMFDEEEEPTWDTLKKALLI